MRHHQAGSLEHQPVDVTRRILRAVTGTLLPVGLLLILVAVVYAPTLRFDFVNWDDPWYVENNELIKGWSFSNLYAIATESVARNYAPLTIFSFLLDHTFWGPRAGGYHFTNVLLHAANTVLVFLLMRQLSRHALVAWGTAAIFAVHPLQVETVAWVSSRKGLLSGLFILWSLRYWLREARTSNDEFRGTLLLLLALLSKAIAVVLPPIVVAYDVLIRRKTLAESITRQVIPAFLCLWLVLQTMGAQTTIVGGVRGHIGTGLHHILAVDLVILWKYVGMLLHPHDLCVLYDQPIQGIFCQFILATIAWCALGGLCWYCRDRARWALFALGTWLLLLLPVLNLFPLTTLMNDRYLYLPMIPFFASLLQGMFAGARYIEEQLRWSTVRYFRPATLLTVCSLVCGVALFAAKTQAYLPVWRDGYSLWSHARREAPQLAVVQIQWANTLHAQGDAEGAITALEYAMECCAPDGPDRERIERKLRDWSQADAAVL